MASIDCSITNRTLARATASSPCASAMRRTYTRPRGGSIKNSVACPAMPKSRRTRARLGAASLGGAMAAATSSAVMTDLRVVMTFNPFGASISPDRRRQRLRLVRRCANHQLDAPAGRAARRAPPRPMRAPAQTQATTSSSDAASARASPVLVQLLEPRARAARIHRSRITRRAESSTRRSLRRAVQLLERSRSPGQRFFTHVTARA